MKKGIALIDLIITIIVVVILAAISIYSGYGTIGKANLAKFTQEFSNFETAIRNIARDKRQNYVLSGARKSDSDIYKEIAGSDVPLDVPKKLKKNISGTVLYEIVVDEISGIDPKKFGGKTYISDKGEVLVIPAYQTLSSDGTLIEYASSSIKYPVVPSIEDDILVGHWIEFDTSASDVTIDLSREVTGASKDYSHRVSDITTNWRVWKNNGDGTIDIVPGQGPLPKFELIKTVGYTAAPEIFKTYAKAFANNSKYLSTEANGRPLTEAEWSRVYAQNPELYNELIATASGNRTISYWLDTKYRESGYDRIRTLKYNSKDNSAAFWRVSFASTITSLGEVPCALPIVTIGEGLKIDNSDKNRDGSTPERKWVLKIAN